ncbi:HprK-related kinase B [Magnetospira sp. QH-2]|uniref:HprK-related kinase B n=1 Tax=Magnetospira sp. (strain QH-2) TaxID=1288970 RepID=UPI0003E816C9|nr:HprK-related kinase B [Magnetospira sp. QH-2]CCQ72149.1 conserved protein of unknown function [Magnetospira sp. QH-2]
MTDAAVLASHMAGDLILCDTPLDLDLGGDGFTLRVVSNEARLIDSLRHYFRHLSAPSTVPDRVLKVWQREEVPCDIPFADWSREPGKTGRKDAYADLPDARLVRKVRTGMLFLQAADRAVCAGPCLANENQVINFINSQYMTWLQQRGNLICHAAGLAANGQGLGLAGLSAGGKSTLMLHLLERDDVTFVSNDRLLVRREDGKTIARGIPKLPRINPGTVVHNPRLHPLIDDERRQELLALPNQALWELEQKHDVDILTLYGEDRIVPQTPLSAFVILNWSRDSTKPWRLQEVDLADRRDLLRAVMKSPGPFHQYGDGRFQADHMPFDESAYLSALAHVSCHEVTGQIDFDGVSAACAARLLGAT